MTETHPFCSVLIPTLNEERHIASCLRALLDQVPVGCGEVILLDGGSADRTVDIARSFETKHRNLRVVHNPHRIQSSACNLGASLAERESTVLIRADAHATYPANFIELCSNALTTHGATSVVVPMKTIGTAPLQRAIAAAQNSFLGNGGSRHRRGGVSGFVDHGHHAAFDRRFFEDLGGYDETFTHNEDAELDVRARAAGGRIWLCTEATIGYFPRSTFGALSRQYTRHGAGRARTVLKHEQRPKLRQLIPVGVLAAAVLAPFCLVYPLFAAPITIYAFICTAISLALAARSKDWALIAAGPAAAVMHLSWSWGFTRVLFRRLLGSSTEFFSSSRFPFRLLFSGR